MSAISIRRSTGSRSRAGGLACKVECRQYPSPPVVSVRVSKPGHPRVPVPRPAWASFRLSRSGRSLAGAARSGSPRPGIQDGAGHALLNPEHQPGDVADGAEPRCRIPPVTQPGQYAVQRPQVTSGFRGRARHDLEHADRAGPVGSPERAFRLAALRRCQRDQVQAGLFPQDPPKLAGRAFRDPIAHFHSVR